jgi:amino acid adenylation domain-containing protein
MDNQLTINQAIAGFRLSPQQKRLWQLQQRNPVYCVQGAILIEGNLNPEVIKIALQQIINRHEILRTNFVRPMGVKTPVQVVSDRGFSFWQEIDLSNDDYGQIGSIFSQEKCQPFNFEQGSLLRATLLKRSTDKHILLLTLPVLCCDRFSLNNLFQELGQAYDACLDGRELDDDVVQYVQFSEWQHQLLEEENAEAENNYWQQQIFIDLKLPFERKILADNSPFTVNSVEFQIARIETLLQQYNIDTSIFLLTCWIILLWRFSGQTKITITHACDGRKFDEIKTAIGLFAQDLPLSYSMQENYQFREILQQVDRTVKNSSEWQEYFTGESREPTYKFEFVEQPYKYTAGDVSFSFYRQYACLDRFKIKFSCLQQEDTLDASLHYDRNLFSEEDVKRFAEHLQTLIASAIANLETKISQLEILSDRQRYQLLIEFNQNQNPPSKIDWCIHQLFEEQVTKTPNNIAVVCEGQQITYARLNTRANQIAHYLQKLGVKPDVVVGICLKRSLDAIACILGILKAGGAYLPLDPNFPSANLAFRLQDAQAPILLTDSSNKKQHSSLQTDVVICLDTDWEIIATESKNNPSTSVTSANLVYTIYTSGSTGKPKGVAVEHRQLLNYLHGIVSRLDLTKANSFATVSTLAADLGNTVIFPALCTGGCLHIISSERASDPHSLAQYCRQYPIDCLKIVPSHLEALLACADADNFLPRSHLILGGEACSWQLIERIHQIQPNCTIFNHYGPTETTVGILTYQIETIPLNPNSQIVPLGKPLANTQVYILDPHLQPVPIGVSGELYISGEGVARGYLNRPELTAERFIRHPFSQDPEAKLYKTGDIVRYRSDGNLEFLGRVDEQIKIRGFRLELGEIEAILGQHPDIQQAVVTLHEDEPDNKRLVAYIVSSPKSDDWCNFLKEKLPDYAIPSVFVPLKTLPLTPNGKVDKKALPTPDRFNSRLQNKFIPPREAIELQLIQIWSELLQVQPIGVTDNFFDLGGHSLLAVRLIAQIEKHFGQKLPLSTLLQQPTIERLAAMLRSSPQSLSRSPLVKIQPKGTKKPFFCVHPIGGNVICYYDLANHLGTERPFYGLEAPGLYGECQPCDRIEDLAREYIKAIRLVQSEGSYLLGGWSMGGVIAFEMAIQLQQQGQKVDRLVLLDTRSPSTNKPSDITQSDDAQLLADIAESTARFFGQDLSISVATLRQLEQAKQLNYVLEIMKQANFVPPDIGLEQIRSFLQISKSNTRALNCYEPKIYSGQITFFQSTEKTSECEDIPDPISGWQAFCSKTIEVHLVPGDHSTMLAEPNVLNLAEKLKVCLEESE